MFKESKDKDTQFEIPSGGDMPILEINPGASWQLSIALVLLGILFAYGLIVIATSKGLAIPGVINKEVIREVPTVKESTTVKEIPTEKVKIIERHNPVYVDRIIEKPVRVSVPTLPQRVLIDTPRNIPGCFPVVVHLFFGYGESRSYQATVCGRPY